VQRTFAKTMEEDEISFAIRGAAFKIYNELGPGLLESVYEASMSYLLQKDGFDVRVQAPIPVIFNDVKLEIGFRLDLLVNNKVIVEVKSTEALNKVHFKQVLTYLKLSGRKLGLLINFNEVPLKIVRIVNKL